MDNLNKKIIEDLNNYDLDMIIEEENIENKDFTLSEITICNQKSAEEENTFIPCLEQNKLNFSKNFNKNYSKIFQQIWIKRINQINSLLK
jgi:uncharacterized protein YecT (DUF1311 family)